MLQNVYVRIHAALGRPQLLQNVPSPNNNLQKWGASAWPCWKTDPLWLPTGDCHNGTASVTISTDPAVLLGDWDMIPEVHTRIRFVYGDSKTLSILELLGTRSGRKCYARLFAQGHRRQQCNELTSATNCLPTSQPPSQTTHFLKKDYFPANYFPILWNSQN